MWDIYLIIFYYVFNGPFIRPLIIYIVYNYVCAIRIYSNYALCMNEIIRMYGNIRTEKIADRTWILVLVISINAEQDKIKLTILQINNVNLIVYQTHRIWTMSVERREEKKRIANTVTNCNLCSPCNLFSERIYLLYRFMNKLLSYW